MNAPCILIEIGSPMLKTYKTEMVDEINVVVCYCLENKDLNVINIHNGPLITMSCCKKDVLAVVKTLSINLKIIIPFKDSALVSLKKCPLYEYFAKLFIKQPEALTSGKWGCISAGFGIATFCFCKKPLKSPHGMLI